jgi:hypothetical protein
MSTTIAEHYSDELDNWVQSLHFYNVEMDLIESKLYEIVRRNCIVGIAEKVNTYQVRLSNLSEKFDSLINYETEKLQTELRTKMEGLEKKYIDVRQDCNSFLTDTLKND